MISVDTIRHITKRVVRIFHPFFILLFVLPFSSFASFSFTDKTEAAYHDYLNLRIEKGNSLIAQALKEKPNNGITIYLANYGDAIKVFLSEDEKLYKTLSKNEDIRIKKIQSLDKTSPYYRFTQAEIKLQWAFVKLKMGEEMNAMLGIRAAYKLLEENMKLHPDFIPNKKTMGLLNVLIGSIPSNYNWVLSLVGMEGNIDKGVQQLNEVVNSENPFRIEASILKVVVENYIVHANNDKLDDAMSLYKSNPDNILVNYLYAAILVKNSRSAEAFEVIGKRPKNPAIQYFPHVDLILGELNLYKGEYATARTYYNNFLLYYKGKNSIKDTYFKLFLSYWLNDEDEKARPYLDKILNNGRELYDSDKHAQKIAKSREIPDKLLTKVRLYTDGGYYDKAYELLNSVSLGRFERKREKLEYLYRTGRLNHKAGKYSDAITYYQKTIELSKDETYYFAPNSALQLGYIYQAKKEKEEARKYFNMALEYKNYEYKNSIDNKAKAALNALKE